MKFKFQAAKKTLVTTFQAVSVLGPGSAEFLLGPEVVKGERAVMLAIYVGVFVLFNALAFIIAGLEFGPCESERE